MNAAFRLGSERRIHAAAKNFVVRAGRDAAHIALAIVHRMDILLTWNCRHIANASIGIPLRRLAEAEGRELPVICTPEELLAE
jgi:hypothetical protein